MWNNPVPVKELRAALRSGRSSVVLAVYVTALAAVIAAIYPRQKIIFPHPSEVNGRTGPARLSIAPPYRRPSPEAERSAADVGRDIFNAFTRAQFILVLLLVPALTAPALTSEKEKQTLETLLVSGLTPYQIVLGKFMYSLFHVSLLIIASVPLTAVSFMLGGVSPMELAATYGLTFALAVGLTLMSLIVSAAVSRSHVATVMVYGLTAALVSAYVVNSRLLHVMLVLVCATLIGGAWVALNLFASGPESRWGAMFPIQRWQRWLQVGMAIAALWLVLWVWLCTYDQSRIEHLWLSALPLAGVIGWTLAANPLVIAALLLARPPTPRVPLRHRWASWLENWSNRQARTTSGGRQGELRPTYGVKPFIADGANPVLARELRGSLFGRKEQFVRVLYVVTITAELLLIAFGRFDELFSLLPILFRWYCVGNVVVILAVGAALGALTFSLEREQRSLDLLLATPLSPKQIVFGKLASACYFVGYLVIASLPVVGFAFILSVIPWYAALFVTLGFIIWGAWAAVVGVWCSLLFSRARQAVGAALGVVLLLVAGSALAAGLTSISYAWFKPDNFTLILFALLPPFQTGESLRHLAGIAWGVGSSSAALSWLLTYTAVSLLAYATCFVLMMILAPWTFTRCVRRTQP